MPKLSRHGLAAQPGLGSAQPVGADGIMLLSLTSS
jgi:hypothetical protein